MIRSVIAAILTCVLGAAFACANAASLPADVADNAHPTPHTDWRRFEALVVDAEAAMMTDPEAALSKARAAQALAEGSPESARQRDALATTLWLEGEALTRVNKIPEARATLERAIPLADSDRTIDRLDGHIALALARVGDSSGDVAMALKHFHRAHEIFAKLGEARSQAMALQGLGSIYDQARDFDRAISYYRRSAQVYSDPKLELASLNNVGFALFQMKRYDEAIQSFHRALTLAEGSPYLQGNILSNLAAAYGRSGRFAEADKAATDALRLFGSKDDSGSTPFIWAIKAEIDFTRGDPATASADLDYAFRGVDLKTTVAPFRDMHEIAYKVYRAEGDTVRALEHLEAFKRLDDEGRSLAATANLALMSAQFDFASQKFEIEHLKSEQLRRDISLRESRAGTQRTVFGALILISVLILVVLAWRNISARKHRAEIMKANVALTKTLGERDREIVSRAEIEWQLRQAKESAEQANRAKSQFLANMSHELRTPLNAIMGFSEMISQEAVGPIANSMYKGYGADIYTSGKHLLSILNDILDMARVDAGVIDLVEEELVLSDVIDAALVVFANDIRNGKNIRFDDPDHKLRIRGDDRLLRQIVINLVSNSVKFTSKNGRVDIRLERFVNGVDIVVDDDGIGIPAEKRDMVMQPFGQVDDAFSRSHGGIGLGLPIVKSLTELHGGVFTLESEENQGTRARVHLPAERILVGNSWPARSACIVNGTSDSGASQSTKS